MQVCTKKKKNDCQGIDFERLQKRGITDDAKVLNDANMILYNIKVLGSSKHVLVEY